MTDLEIRPITADDDFEAQLDLGQRAFGAYSGRQRESFLRNARRQAARGLFLGAFLGGQPVGAAMIYHHEQYWLGRPLPCAGVASVKVAPEHRGLGIGRALMTELLALMDGRGYLLSALYPATTPIYRSLGWELAGAKHQFSVPAHALRALVAPDGDGSVPALPPVRRATPDDGPLVNEVIGRSHRLGRHAGPITWDEETQRDWLADPALYSYLAAEPAEGFAAYRWGHGGTEELFVERVHAVTPGALRALWSVIASNGSVTRTVSGWTDPGDPFWWLTRERDATISRRSMWMLRVVDAPAAIAARGFPAGVSVTVPLQLRDQFRPANTGSWELTVSHGTAILRPNGGAVPPDPLTLGPRGLAALYAGIPVGSLRLSGLARGGAPDTDAALDAAFAATPFMVDNF